MSNVNYEFHELNTVQSIVMLAGAVLMCVGMGLYVFMVIRTIAACIFLCGTLMFATMQCLQSYKGTDFILRRLKSIQNLADLMFVLAGILMIDTVTQFMMPMFSNVETYLEFVYNKWLIFLLVGVILEVYTSHRISNILKKQSKKNE